MLKANFNIHGLGLKLSADHWDLFDMIAEELLPFRESSESLHQDPKAVQLHLAAMPPKPNPGPPSEPIRAYQNNWRFFPPHPPGKQTTLYGRNMVTVVEDLKQRKIQIGAVPEPWMVPDPAYHYCFTHPVGFWLKQQGLFFLHAGCVSSKNRGILIAGPSHAGKTTFTLLAVRSGFKFLSDEQPLLSNRRGKLRAHPFPRRLRVDRDLLRFFPEIKPFASPSNGQRIPLPLEAVWPNRLGKSCPVRLLIFPRFKAGSRLSARRLKPTQIIQALLQDDYFIWYRHKPLSSISETHLTLFEKLAATVPAFEVTYNHKSFQAVPDLLKRLIGSTP